MTCSPAANSGTCCCEAIRYGNQPEVKAKLNRVIDAKVGEGLAEMVREHALSSEVISTADLERIRADMLEAEARKLQPGYVTPGSRRPLRSSAAG